MSKKSIFWFRDDLRLHDNPTLLSAISNSDFLLPVYILNPRDYGTTSFGFPKTGNFRAQFIKESVLDLRESIRSLGSDLLILKGYPDEVILDLVKNFGIQSVYASKGLGWHEVQDEVNLKNQLDAVDCKLFLGHNGFLIHPEDIPFDIEQIPLVFTDFRKKIEKHLSVRNVLSKPEHISTVFFEPQYNLGFSEWEIKVSIDHRSVLPFIGGEQAGLKRLKNFIWDQDLLKTYKETRNGLIGADYSTKFSPWLAIGAISPRLIYQEVKKYEFDRIANQSTYWLIFELYWRDYFRYLLLKFGRKVFLKTGIKGSIDKSLENDFDALQLWIDGKTTEPFINANMLELKQSGFMSNRGRQNVASYLVNDLKVNWLMGAEYFESQLIDYDISSNWCNWNYIAGVGTDPRENRYFNIKKQSEIYDPNGDYVKLWIDLQ